MKRQRTPKVEKADGSSHKSNYHRFLKKRKNRLERKKAKCDPETQPTYGKYYGYET